MESHETEQLTQLALACNPQYIANALEREINKAKSEGDDPARVSFCLLDIRPYNVDVKDEMGIVEADGYCSRMMIENDSVAFRGTLLDLIHTSERKQKTGSGNHAVSRIRLPELD